MSAIDPERFARHLLLREIGGPGQQRLAAARVFVTGAGGLGCPAALYLAAAGTGALTIADPDRVSLDNLQRQILYRTADAGAGKAETAKAALAALNPHCAVTARAEAVTADNARELIRGHDLVLDGTDDFETRFIVNQACYDEGIPLVSGALGRWDGQVAVFAAGLTKGLALKDRAPCYRCLVPQVPPEAETCARVGVAGPLTGVIGSMMALEALKWIVRAGTPLAGRVLFYDGLSGQARVARLKPDPACPVCGGQPPAASR